MTPRRVEAVGYLLVVFAVAVLFATLPRCYGAALVGLFGGPGR